MRKPTVDLLILGAGSAGLSALRVARQSTQNVAIVNDGPWGTMCARTGCMPSKTLIEAANAFYERTRFKAFGIEGGAGLKVNDRAVLARVRKLRDHFVEGMVEETNDLGDRAISGRARFETANDIVIDEKRVIHARRVIVATGSSPIVPKAFEGLDQRLLTTDTLFEQKRLPRRLAVIGQGALGVELAQALARLGVDVTAFEKSKLVAGLTDPVVSAKLFEALGEEYPLHLGASAQVDLAGHAVHVKSGRHQATVDAVLVALGRAPNIKDLGLERIGETLDANGLPKVDPMTMRAGNSPVFFAGDVDPSTAPAVLHEARDEGRIAAMNALSKSPRPVARKTPLVIVFTAPNAAIVGTRFSKLDPQQTTITQADFGKAGRAAIALEPFGALRVYSKRKTGVIVGAEMTGPAVEHLAQLLAVAVEHGLTVDQLKAVPFYHPTYEETLVKALG